jgi:hypothetical protein
VGSEIVGPGSSDIGQPEEPWNAGRVVGSVVTTCQVANCLVPPSWRGIIGKHAKALLDDGFPGDLVTAACYMAVLRGRPEIAQYIAGDLMLAGSGQAMSRGEYEQKLALYAAGNGRAAEMLAEQRERIAKRDEEIERRRNGR